MPLPSLMISLPAGSDARPVERVLLLATPNTYRAQSFSAAAKKLGVEILWGLDMPAALCSGWPNVVALNLRDRAAAGSEIVALGQRSSFAAVLALDDAASLAAADACERLGLEHNAPAAALAARDKLVMRECLQAAGVRGPDFCAYDLQTDAVALAQRVVYPCVLKPTLLNGSRGVIRANSASEFVAAWARVCAIVLGSAGNHVLVEDYMPGAEVAVECLLTATGLQVLAVFDKPDALEGPFFEETIYVTPSRLADAVLVEVAAVTAAAATALGLRTGPLHAELRINAAGVWPLELNARSIGGRCSSTVRLDSGVVLEELILLQAVGRALPPLRREEGSRGVMMIPIPADGMLREVRGLAQARAVAGVDEVDISARLNYPLVRLPEGDGYLGFIVAHADTPGAVEAALREAHRRLGFVVEPQILLRAK